jgi:hypothetical protein
MPLPPCLRLAPFLTALLLPLGAHAQLVPLAEGGARALALGRAATALEGDAWGHYNPASWATLPGRAGAAFASQAFGLAELRVGALAVAEPTRFGTIAGTARTYGFSDFRETSVGLGFARSIPVSATRAVHGGLHLRYYAVSIPEYGSAGTLGLSLGALMEVVPGLQFGFLAQNVNRPGFSDLDPLQATLDVGLAYEPIEEALVLFSVAKDLDYPVSFRGGLEVRPVDELSLRAGFSTAPVRFTTGVGVAVGVLRADVAAERHEVLGWTPAFGVGVQF